MACSAEWTATTAGEDEILVLSHMDTCGREIVLDYIARQMVENSSLSVQRDGCFFLVQVVMPLPLLERVRDGLRALPSAAPTSIAEVPELQQQEEQPSPPRDINSKRDRLRSIEWLLGILHDFLSEVNMWRLNLLSSSSSPSSLLFQDGCNPPDIDADNSAGSEDEDEEVMSRLVATKSESSFPPFPLDIRAELLKFLFLRCGEDALVRQTGRDLLLAIQHHRNCDVEVQMFSALLSSTKYDKLDMWLFLQWWAELRQHSQPDRSGTHCVTGIKLWWLVKRCISICSLSSVVKTRVSNRVANVIARWIEKSKGNKCGENQRCDSRSNGLGLSIPDTADHPYLFCLPYNVNLLEWYTGASITPPNVDDLLRRFAATQVIRDAILLALLLVNTKMERFCTSVSKSLQPPVTTETHGIVSETSLTSLSKVHSPCQEMEKKNTELGL